MTNEADAKAEDWIRYLKVCGLKMSNLRSILRNDGEAMLVAVLKKLKLASPVDVVKACEQDDGLK